MIISHKYKYIFLKTKKTAGTSIEISLSRFCGPDDIVTPISPKDEETRQELGIFPRNYSRPLPIAEYQPRDFFQLIAPGEKNPQKKVFGSHTWAEKIKNLIAPEIWDNYFKFCFVRNPWEQVISRYYFFKSRGRKENLEEFCNNVDLARNLKIYTIDDKIAVDFVGKYENLRDDLGIICGQLNIPFDNWLPHAKGGMRTDRRHYSEILTKEHANLIREKCAQEIEWFGYEFEAKK